MQQGLQSNRCNGIEDSVFYHKGEIMSGNIQTNTTEQTNLLDLQRLQALRYMDDDFMTVCLADNFEGVELILWIVLRQDDIGRTYIKAR